jgi:hypothetical protein
MNKLEANSKNFTVEKRNIMIINLYKYLTVYLYMYTYRGMYIFMYIYIHTYVYIYIHMNILIYVYIYIYQIITTKLEAILISFTTEKRNITTTNLFGIKIGAYFVICYFLFLYVISIYMCIHIYVIYIYLYMYTHIYYMYIHFYLCFV